MLEPIKKFNLKVFLIPIIGTLAFFVIVESVIRVAYSIRNSMADYIPLPYMMADYEPVPPWRQ